MNRSIKHTEKAEPWKFVSFSPHLDINFVFQKKQMFQCTEGGHFLVYLAPGKPCDHYSFWEEHLYNHARSQSKLTSVFLPVFFGEAQVRGKTILPPRSGAQLCVVSVDV